MIRFDSEICNNFERASSREWLETNGMGGFASGTVSGANSRRYHGLLVAATAPPLGRVVMLSKFEETVFIDGKNYELSANRYPNRIYPEGCKYLKSFALNPFPTWTFEVEGVEIEKNVFMIHGENSTVCRWSVVGGRRSEKEEKSSREEQRTKDKRQISLELKPLLAFRDYHHLRADKANFDENFVSSGSLASVAPRADLPALYFSHNAARAEKTGFWYKDFEYAIEEERGFDFREDLFQPFALRFDLNEPATVVASTEKQDASGFESFRRSEIERRERLIEIAETEDDFAKQLVLAADQFVVRRGAGRTIIAGYPWFSDWGRDTMIALPGLTLATNRPEIARDILLEFSRHISEGMIPNRFPDAGDEAEYNTVDASLWFFEAARAYAEKTGDYAFVEEHLYEKLVEIVAWHLKGTRYDIHVDTDGLLCAGTANSQLTWMDAKIGDYVATPRRGKPVEIQALWHNALLTMAGFAGRFRDADGKAQYEALARAAKHSFNGLFWNAAENCLFDVVENGTRDASVRPNQIFAVSLHYPLVEGERARRIVEKVEAELLTPYGLRTLAPGDEKYRPVYIGSPFERDSAYHQGTIWAWLVGSFIDAYRRVYGAGEAETEQRIGEILANFKTHLTEAGVGQISEIFDAAAPHNPRGCPAQAWSAAEVLRVLKNKI